MAEGVIATIKIKAPNNAPSSIPMWHYDEGKAKWIEEGVGKLNEGFYTADVSHFTKWNWDRPYDETSKLIGRVIDSDGKPIEGANVVQKGVTIRFQNSIKTDENGEFELRTPESNESEIEAKVEFYSSTIVNYTTSPTKRYRNDIGELIIDVSIDNIIPPFISNDVLYITMGKTAIIKGDYLGEQKRAGYKLNLNGNDVETIKWKNDLIEFEVPMGIPEEGIIQIDRDGVLSREVSYEEGDWTCEINGVVYDNNDLPKEPILFTNFEQTRIRISNSSIEELSECIGNLTALERFELDRIQINSLPETIGKLRNLKYLSVYLTKLNHLPDNIGELQSIQYLSLMQNQLKSIPESISNLKNIIQLDLMSNELSEYPNIISELKTLKYLSLAGNQINSLPESINNLQNIEELHLFNCNLKALPKSIGNIKNLVYLQLTNNQLTALPESIGNLHNIKRLHIENNLLTTLPESLKDLKDQLEFLLLQGNNFSEEEKAKIEGWLPDTKILW
jgi:hypothetical protein